MHQGVLLFEIRKTFAVANMYKIYVSTAINSP